MQKLSLVLLFFSLVACQPEKQNVDTLFYNGTVYSVNDTFETFEAFVVKEGKIVYAGNAVEAREKYSVSEEIDLLGQFVYPGFIDAHAHLYNLGMQLQQVNLVGATSYEEVIQRMLEFQKENNTSYIIGRGWDQTKWEVDEFPTNDRLDEFFPDVPVALSRIDGHALLCNSLALKKAGITTSTEIFGGEIQKKNGKLTGILIDNPMKLVFDSFPKPSLEVQTKALKEAEAICIKYGLTSLSDAGLDKQVIELIDSLQQAGELSLRVYAMLSNTAENLNAYLDKPPYKTDRLNVRSVKVYSDGALGSRGAALKQPYSDHHGHFGSMLIGLEELQQLAKRIEQTDFQMNTHAISDSANSSVLRTYAEVLKGKKDQRWRVEHAQILDSAEIAYFSTNILPSVQPTHATSDMY